MPSVILLLILPLFGAVLCALLPARHADKCAIGATGGMLLSLVWLLLARPGGNWQSLPLTWRWLQGSFREGLFGFLLDPLALLLLLVVVVLGFLVVLYATAYLGAGNREHADVTGKSRHHD